MALSKADITSRQERRVEELNGLLADLEFRIVRMRELDARQPPLPKGTGSAIIEHFGLEPGPMVGQLRKALEQAVEQGRLERDLPMQDYLDFLQDYIRSQGQH